MLVDITDDVIAQAERNRLHNTAWSWCEYDHVACAVKKQIPKATVSVGINMVTIKYPDGVVHYFNLPPEGAEIVRRADFREEIAPTKFALTRIR